MEKAAPTTEAAQNNTPVNHNSVKALRHLLAALQAYQELDYATSESCLSARWYWDAIKIELDRLWDGAA
jgi:hypothetical protein